MNHKEIVMEEWNNPKNISMSFNIKPSEELKEFIGRIREEHMATEEAFGRRIRQLFAETVSFEPGTSDAECERILTIFSLGYQHGWNDMKNLHENSSKD